MNFESILFKEKEPFNEKASDPPYFVDLNLNTVIDDIVKQEEGYCLRPFFLHNLKKIENIVYRQRILKDIEEKNTFNALKNFSLSILQLKDNLKRAHRLTCKYQKERWFLDAVLKYCDTLLTLKNNLENLSLRSDGLISFRNYIKSYVNSARFVEMYKESQALESELNSITYSLFIKDNKIRVEKYKEETDYGEEILKVFERFRQGEVEDFIAEFHDTDYMNHIESGILKAVAKLNSETFEKLGNYRLKYKHFFDKIVAKFNREVQFYIAYLEYIEPLQSLGLSFCYPEVKKDKNILNYNGFDIALATKLSKDKKIPVCNDFYMDEPERIFIITGPNQGGKTTFARSFGQMHFLASLGLKVPGKKASLLHFDNIFTHFENEENIETLRGKLEDDLLRVKTILDKATDRSIIIMNEIFSSTSLQDALFLGKKVLEKVLEKDSICVFVTFLDELVSISKKIVSMVSTVSENDVTIRTYKILRKQADGISYAISLAQKHCLTYECLSKRLKTLAK